MSTIEKKDFYRHLTKVGEVSSDAIGKLVALTDGSALVSSESGLKRYVPGQSDLIPVGEDEAYEEGFSSFVILPDDSVLMGSINGKLMHHISGQTYLDEVGDYGEPIYSLTTLAGGWIVAGGCE